VSAETDLGNDISLDKLTIALQEWQRAGIAELGEQRFGSKGSIIWKIGIIGQLESNKQHIQDIRVKQGQIQTTSETGKILKSVLDNISVTFEDRLIINKHSLLLSLRSDRVLQLATQDDLGSLLQRDREIIRYFIAMYLNSLAQQSRNI